MVKDREISEIVERLTTLLKHLPYRKYRVSKACLLNQGTTFTIVLASIDSFAEPVVLSIENTDDLNIKNAIKAVKDCIPEDFLKINVTDISTSLSNISYNFSVENVPSSFEIVKLPYRQLQIKTATSKSFYVDLCTSSYHRLLSLFDRLTVWPSTVLFEDVARNLKRKEIVTLMLSLTSNI